MKYENIVEGKFINRPNRFIAYVEVADRMETVHVKNTGRCRELLLPGNTVGIQRSDNEARKTKYDLISVYKKGSGWVNIDSQAPNKVVGEWLEKQEYDYVKPEYVYGNSRIDFYMEKGAKKYKLRLQHKQNNVPQYYTVRTFVSIPTSFFHKGDSVELHIDTYKGEVIKGFIMRNSR